MTSIMNMLILYATIWIKVKTENELKKEYQNVLLSNITCLLKMEIATKKFCIRPKKMKVISDVSIEVSHKEVACEKWKFCLVSVLTY